LMLHIKLLIANLLVIPMIFTYQIAQIFLHQNQIQCYLPCDLSPSLPHHQKSQILESLCRWRDHRSSCQSLCYYHCYLLCCTFLQCSESLANPRCR
jgi:hypothetical protein